MTRQASTGVHREVFIVRCWRERSESAPWRGQVQHVRSGETVYFRDPQALLGYLERRLRDQPGQPSSPDSGLR